MSTLTKTPLLLETIKIDEGKIYNLPYHQKRCDDSRKSLFHSDHILNLSSIIKPPLTGLYKCRIIYADTLHSIEYVPYQEKEIHSLKIVPSTMSYDFKYANRAKLNALLSKFPHSDELIIEKDGYLTDSTMANIAFYDGTQWITPTNPLLKGTIRQKLLDEGFLVLKDITSADLKEYTQVALMNAMIGFKILKHIHPKEIEGIT